MSNSFGPATARLIFDTMGLSDAFELSYYLRGHPPQSDQAWVQRELLAWLQTEAQWLVDETESK